MKKKKKKTCIFIAQEPMKQQKYSYEFVFIIIRKIKTLKDSLMHLIIFIQGGLSCYNTLKM